MELAEIDYEFDGGKYTCGNCTQEWFKRRPGGVWVHCLKHDIPLPSADGRCGCGWEYRGKVQAQKASERFVETNE